ncbi:hypothetical protein GCM10010206_58640 [Streptomyces cinerochromogenes]|nr:hypothetical protein GCM10010206_58640 [Streptomyces cinerochromogenes]
MADQAVRHPEDEGQAPGDQGAAGGGGAQPGQQEQGRRAVRDRRRRRVTGREVAGPRGHHRCPRPGRPLLQRYDDRRDQCHHRGRGERRQPPPPGTGTPAPPGRVTEGRGEHGERHLDVAEIGEELGEAVRVDEGPAGVRVQPEQRPVDEDLPGDEGQDDRREDQEQHGPSLAESRREGGRPPRNRGGGSEAAVRTGTSRAPGGLGRRPSDR